MERATKRVMILVKAAPVLTSRLEESMCVAAVSLDGAQEWVRLHPVPFRDLADDTRFRKYQEVTVDVVRPRSDRRPESWVPLEGTLQPGDSIGTEHGWSTRRERLAHLERPTMCDLVDVNRSGSGPSTPSLAVIQTLEPPELEITTRGAEQLAKWKQRADAIAAQPSLFDDPDTKKPDFEVVPWRFRYRYRCLAPACKGHSQTIIDWEAVALWRNVRHLPNWQDLMRRKFVDELWAADRQAELFVGNQEQHPHSFLVLGVFWPPSASIQQSLI